MGQYLQNQGMKGPANPALSLHEGSYSEVDSTCECMSCNSIS